MLYIFKEGTFSYRTYLGYVDEEFEPVLNWENSDAKWIAKGELMSHENLHSGFAEMLATAATRSMLEKFAWNHVHCANEKYHPTQELHII